MAIWIDFINLVIPIKTIEEKYPGGFIKCLNDHSEWIGQKVWFDEHLFHDGAMSGRDIEILVNEWEARGFAETEIINGKKIAKDFCVLDGHMTWFECPWLTWLDHKVIHLTGEEPGQIRGPKYLDHELELYPVQTTVFNAFKTNLIEQQVDAIVNPANSSLVGV